MDRPSSNKANAVGLPTARPTKESTNEKVHLPIKSLKTQSNNTGCSKTDNSTGTRLNTAATIGNFTFDHLPNTGTGTATDTNAHSNVNNFTHPSVIYQANGYPSNAHYNTTAYASNNTSLNSASLTAPPHYLSPILNASQPFFRPLMTTQPPLYSPILSGQQHSYSIPHTSPTSASCTGALNDITRNGIEALNCHADIFKEINCRSNSENHSSTSTNKSCNIENQAASSCKRPNVSATYNTARYSSCSVSKHTEQQLFDDYVKMYGEETACKNWADANNFNFGIAQAPHYKGNSYNTNTQQHPGIPVASNNFPDCRIDAFWSRAAASASNESFNYENQYKSMNKSCTGTATMSNNLPGTSKSADQAKISYDYQQPQLSTMLPFLQPITSHEERAQSKALETDTGINVATNDKKFKDSSSCKTSKKLQVDNPQSTSSNAVTTGQINSDDQTNGSLANVSQSVNNYESNSHQTASTSVANSTTIHSNQEQTPNCSESTKYEKDNLSRCNTGQLKKSMRKDAHCSNSTFSECCLLCGTMIEASTHCMIDNLMTVPSKITVSEKLNLMIGFPVPRDLFPSLCVCPKCFHLINEVDVLEHRLNVYRREVLFFLEGLFERNGINLSPYKRYSRQQGMGHHEMQFSHYQQVGPNSCLHSSFQNDNQSYQNYSIDHQLQNCNMNQAQHQIMQQMNANMEVQFHPSSNMQSLHNPHQQASDQMHSNNHSIVEQKHPQKKVNDLKIQHHLSNQYPYNEHQTIDHNLENVTQMIQPSIGATSHPMDLNHTEQHQQCSISANRNVHLSDNQLVQGTKGQDQSIQEIKAIIHSDTNEAKKESHEEKNLINNSSLPLMMQDSADNILVHPMSVLLSYPSVDPKEINSQLLAASSGQQFGEAVVFSSPESDPPATKYASIDKEKSSPLNNVSKCSPCEPGSLPPTGTFNTPDCDIDIEKCDPNVDNESHLSQMCSSVSEKTPLDSLSQNSIVKNMNIDSEVDTLLDISSPHQSIAISRSTDGLDIILSSESPPLPPEAPPQGLRNVQDATEYHKPTLLGNTYKGKKHAKLQICRQCDQVFSNRQSLIKHIERRHKASNYRCETCHRKFNSERTLNRHVRLHRTYPCNVCDKIFLKRTKLKKHLEEHSKENLTCKTCHRELTSIQALISHEKTHGRITPVYDCTICSKKFASSRNLNHHSRIHSGEKPFECTNCHRNFRHKSNMIVHNKLCTGNLHFICASCGRSFALQSLYDRHMAEHEGRFAHRCSICNKGLSKPADLRLHFLTHNTSGVTPDKSCSVCDSSGSCNQIQVTQQKRSKRYVCPVCNKAMTRKCSLEDHLAQHNGKREHKCKECNGSFVYRANLTFHVKSFHRKNQSCACNICHKTFAHARFLKVHMRVHTGERPYQCDSCGKAFARMNNYQRHLKCHVVHVTTQAKEESERNLPMG